MTYRIAVVARAVPASARWDAMVCRRTKSNRASEAAWFAQCCNASTMTQHVHSRVRMSGEYRCVSQSLWLGLLYDMVAVISRECARTAVTESRKKHT